MYIAQHFKYLHYFMSLHGVKKKFGFNHIIIIDLIMMDSSLDWILRETSLLRLT